MTKIIRNVGILLLFTTTAALGSPLYAVGSQGNLSFSALFNNLGGGILQVTLSNTGAIAATDESGVIGAIFFSLDSDPVLTPVSLSLGAGSSIVNGDGDPAANWQYKAGLNGPGGSTQGLSAAGYGLFGSRGNFCSGDGCGNLLQGIDWGLVDSAYTAGSGNSSINTQPMIQDTVVFSLSGIPEWFDPSTGVTNVSAQYTASLDGPNVPDPPSVPEPASYLLIAAGLGVMGRIGKAKRIDRNVPEDC